MMVLAAGLVAAVLCGWSCPVCSWIGVVQALAPRTSDDLQWCASQIEAPQRTGIDAGAALVDAWNRLRAGPPCSPADLERIFAVKRASLDRIAVTCRVSLSVDATRAGALASELAGMESDVWWVHWWADGSRRSRTVSSTRAGLVNGIDRRQWITDGRRTWLVRGTGEPVEAAHDPSLLLGLEDSWIGAGGCIGDRLGGTTRASEHDLALALSEAHAGTVIVESLPGAVGGVATIVLRLGWVQPIFIHLDPVRGLAPVRIDRYLDYEGQAILARTELHDLEVFEGGTWLPRRIHLAQFVLPAGVGRAGDDGVGQPFLELDQVAVSLMSGGGGMSAVEAPGATPGGVGVLPGSGPMRYIAPPSRASTQVDKGGRL